MASAARAVGTDTDDKPVRLRTLVLDDDESTRVMLSSALRQLGHTVVALEDAETALATHERHPFALMVIDWILPGMDGLTLCRKVRELPGGEGIAIVVVTARTRPEDLDAVLRSGANDYIAKPVNPGELITRLRVAERSAVEKSKRLAAERALRHNEANLRALIENTDDWIVSFDSDFRVLTCNSAAREATKVLFDKAVSVGADVRTCGMPDVASQLKRAILGGRFSTEWSVRTDDRGEVFLESSFHPIHTDDGRVAGSACYTRDVTERYKAERERKQLEGHLQLTERLSSLTTLAGGVAHEINNPLGTIVLSLDWLKRSIDDDAARDAIGDARQSADRIRRVVGALTRLSTASEDETIQPVDVQGPLDAAIEIAKNEIRHKARLVREYGETPLALGAEGLLAQVFLQLLVNAVQAIPEGHRDEHEIRVRTYADRNGDVVVEVRDSGLGVPEDIRSRIFDPFFTTRPVGEGTGLGLAISHSIISRLGGRLTLLETESGAAFVAVLKAAEEVPIAVRAPRSATDSDPAPGARVLVVDDEPRLRRSMRRALVGHEVALAADGEQALEELANGPFDLILCDVMMPGVDGIEFYERVAEKYPGLEKQIVFMTGGAFTPAARSFLGRVSNTKLVKPFPIETLRDLVKERMAERE